MVTLLSASKVGAVVIEIVLSVVLPAMSLAKIVYVPPTPTVNVPPEIKVPPVVK
jgi:hypothetical protein